MPHKEWLLAVGPDGDITTIYDDELVGMFDGEGRTTITRASHVEPTPSGKWIADMGPVIKQRGIECDNPILGPFDLRQQALDAEIEWLKERLFT